MSNVITSGQIIRGAGFSEWGPKGGIGIEQCDGAASTVIKIFYQDVNGHMEAMVMVNPEYVNQICDCLRTIKAGIDALEGNKE